MSFRDYSVVPDAAFVYQRVALGPVVDFAMVQHAIRKAQKGA